MKFEQKFCEYLEKESLSKFGIASLLAASILSCWFSYAHYKNIFPGNSLSWVFWLVSMASLIAISIKSDVKDKTQITPSSQVLILMLAATALFFITHTFNWNTSPWNNYGLFDDAAWDLYFLKDKVLGDAPFQTIYFDDVGIISREALFHHYVAIFFKALGYNLQAFNAALLFLGFLTVLFVTLVIYEQTKNLRISLLGLMLVNFYPLILTQTFQGHRYAIVPPLIVAAYYYGLLAYRHRSVFFAVMSGLLAAVSVQGGVAGKQFLLAVFIAIIINFTIDKKWKKDLSDVKITAWAFFALAISCVPLIFYINFNSEIYSIREKGLLTEFFGKFKDDGFNGVSAYIDLTKSFFLDAHSGTRQFMGDFRPVPLLLIPALLIALYFSVVKKRYELVLLTVLPVVSATVAGMFDFRVAHAAPFLIIMLFTPFIVAGHEFAENIMKPLRYVSIISIGLTAIVGAGYGLKLSESPNHIYLLPHVDVAVSRYMQDLAYEAKEPNIEMKRDEFNRKFNDYELKSDIFVCPEGAYAIAHLFLKDRDDKRMLSLCNQSIQRIQSPDELMKGAIDVISSYRASPSKDLILVWQKTDKIEQILEALENSKAIAKISNTPISVDGVSTEIIAVKIKSENVLDFKNQFIYSVSKK